MNLRGGLENEESKASRPVAAADVPAVSHGWENCENSMLREDEMTIHVKPEQEQVIGQASQAGLTATAEYVAKLGVETAAP